MDGVFTGLTSSKSRDNRHEAYRTPRLLSSGVGATSLEK